MLFGKVDMIIHYEPEKKKSYVDGNIIHLYFTSPVIPFKDIKKEVKGIKELKGYKKRFTFTTPKNNIHFDETMHLVMDKTFKSKDLVKYEVFDFNLDIGNSIIFFSDDFMRYPTYKLVQIFCEVKSKWEVEYL